MVLPDMGLHMSYVSSQIFQNHLAYRPSSGTTATPRFIHASSRDPKLGKLYPASPGRPPQLSCNPQHLRMGLTCLSFTRPRFFWKKQTLELAFGDQTLASGRFRITDTPPSETAIAGPDAMTPEVIQTNNSQAEECFGGPKE